MFNSPLVGNVHEYTGKRFFKNFWGHLKSEIHVNPRIVRNLYKDFEVTLVEPKDSRSDAEVRSGTVDCGDAACSYVL